MMPVTRLGRFLSNMSQGIELPQLVTRVERMLAAVVAGDGNFTPVTRIEHFMLAPVEELLTPVTRTERIIHAVRTDGVIPVLIMEEEQLLVDAIISTSVPAVPDSPGSMVLLGGDTTEGYYGRVLSADFISGDALAASIGLSTGISQYSTVDWLKFSIDGKTFFSPMKPIRHSSTWNDINALGAVYGGKTIIINELTYKVRLWKGANIDPYIESSADKSSIGSEWNRLMYPIHIKAPSNWAQPAFVSSPTKDWGIDFTDQDLLTDRIYGDGSSTLCQETQDAANYRKIRGGYNGVTNSEYDAPSTVYTGFGWRPVLELV